MIGHPPRSTLFPTTTLSRSPAHARHFEQPRRAGDVLVVTLTPDRWVNKGPHRPAFPEDLRLEMVASLACVDYVALNRWPTAVETVKLLRPHLFRSEEHTSELQSRQYLVCRLL